MSEVVDNKWSLFPQRRIKGVSVESKQVWRTRLETEGCRLPVNRCKEEHPAGCLKGMFRMRESLVEDWRISDPRFDEPRAPTNKEIYWWMINDPRSPFSLNYGREDAKTAQQMFGEYVAELQASGDLEKEELDKKFEPISEEKLSEMPEVQKPDPIKTDFKVPNVIPNVKGGIPKLDDWAGKKPAKMSEVIQWVFNNLPVNDVDVATAPSAGAVGLLKWARASATSQQNFYTYFVTKLIPSQKELDHAAKMKDDGSNLFPLLEALLEDESLSASMD